MGSPQPTRYHLVGQLTKDDLDQVEMRKKEMRKIAELKDSYLDCRRRAGSEEAYIARFRL